VSLLTFSALRRRAVACPGTPLLLHLFCFTHEKNRRDGRCPPGAICGATRIAGQGSARAARFVN
jgi:hypothetical protein